MVIRKNRKQKATEKIKIIGGVAPSIEVENPTIKGALIAICCTLLLICPLLVEKLSDIKFFSKIWDILKQFKNF